MSSPETATPAGSWARAEGLPFPLGASWIEKERAWNFALYSKHADSVTLLLYAENDVVRPVSSVALDYLRNKSGRIWHCRIPVERMANAAYYAYRIDGPRPEGRFEWHAFDRDKILLDPYAKSVFLPRDFDRLAAARPGPNDGKAPLGLIRADALHFAWEGELRPRHESDAIIYELHVGGFTRNPNSGIPAHTRGTYAAVAGKIPYLRDLGVTIVELMPVCQFDPSDGDYWGYSPINFFAPHAGYQRSRDIASQHNEFREMVRALHNAGIEVLIDVVFNHTGEGDQRGPVYSYKGIDNSTYYLISDRPGAPYENFSGTGNTLNCANRAVRKMIIDSVHHWACEMHVDGFRFDLASVFARNTDGSMNLGEAPLLGDIAADPALSGVRVIVEPWDAAGAYQLGRAFRGAMASQWNGLFRDDVRRFVKGDPGMVASLMRRLYGSDDLFPDDRRNAYRPYQSINYVASHDGFTLYDLVSYDRRRNWANGHGNIDGPAENYTWNCGWEGDRDLPPDVAALRRRQVKNLCCLLMLSNGTPMFRAGDEFLQTQGGNSNPHNQDNETAWIDWSRLQAHPDVFRFFRGMIAFRKAHPSIARSRFWREDVRWYGVQGPVDLSFESRSLAFALHGASHHDVDLYVMINAWWQPLRFFLQETPAEGWCRIVDTARESPFDLLEPGSEAPFDAPSCELAPRSIVVLASRAVSG